MKQKLALFLVLILLFTLGGCKAEEKKSASSAQAVVGGQAEEETDQTVENQQTETQPSVDKESESDAAKQPEKEQEQSAQKPGAEKPSQTPSEQTPGTSKPEETPSEEQKPQPEKQPDEEPEVEEIKIDYSTFIKVASYNIKNLDGGAQKDKVVEVLKEIDADIVGLQEVDVYTTRGGPNINQAELLAKECGYPYWHFTRSIDYGGGAYGHAILSRYPIKATSAVDFKVISAGDHNRNYGRHVLDVNGTELVVYNTHMTLGSDKENGAELTQVTSAMAKDQYAVLTGDLNMVPDNMGRYVNTKKLTVLNGGDEFVFYVNTFPQGNNSTKPIDNIVVTKTMDYYWSEDNNVGIEVVHTEGSDHNPIYTYINFKE